MGDQANRDQVGLAVATSVGLGAIIGAGIFTLSGTAIALAGDWALFSFVLVGLVAVIVALEVGELSSLFPNLNGASYSFVYEAFGSELGFITGLLLYFSYASSIPVVALGFGSYLANLLGLSAGNTSYFAIALIGALTMVNLGGIRKAARADFGLVIVKVVILLAVILFSAIYVSEHGSATNFLSPTAPGSGVTGVFSASVVVFFAYSGFQAISTFTPSVRGGPKVAARAILLSVVISMVLYIFIATSMLALVPAGRFSINADPLAFVLSAVRAPGYLLSFVDIGALVATTSASLALLLSSSRILRQIGLDGLLPKAVRSYDAKRDVARNGVLISALIAVPMLYSGNIFVIAAISNFGLLFSYLMASLALLHFRRLGKKGSFHTPLYPYLPVTAMLAVMAFMVGMPQQALVFGVVLMLVLLVVYYTLREYEGKEPVRVRFFD
jgi:basic amino acid/polyamine antiporter, APA family